MSAAVRLGWRPQTGDVVIWDKHPEGSNYVCTITRILTDYVSDGTNWYQDVRTANLTDGLKAYFRVPILELRPYEP